MWIYACTYVYLLQTYVSVFKTFFLQDGIYIHNFLCIHMYTYIHVFMSDCEAKKKNAPLFTTFVFTYLHILYLHTRAGSGLRALCICCGCRV
jgi:hypothetical protein